MTMLDPNGYPEHRSSHCQTEQAPLSTHRPSDRPAGVAGNIQWRHQDWGDADCIVITGCHESGRQPTSQEQRRSSAAAKVTNLRTMVSSGIRGMAPATSSAEIRRDKRLSMLAKGLSALDGRVHRLRLRGSAMIRILTADVPNAITITVDRQLVDDCVDAVETCSLWVRGDRSISSYATFSYR